MNKRGSDTVINPLIMIALGVIVLVILIVIFRNQITQGGNKFDDVSDQATLDRSSCTFVLGLTCSQKCAQGKEEPLGDRHCQNKAEKITDANSPAKQAIHCCKL